MLQHFQPTGVKAGLRSCISLNTFSRGDTKSQHFQSEINIPICWYIDLNFQPRIELVVCKPQHIQPMRYVDRVETSTLLGNVNKSLNAFSLALVVYKLICTGYMPFTLSAERVICRNTFLVNRGRPRTLCDCSYCYSTRVIVRHILHLKPTSLCRQAILTSVFNKCQYVI